MSLYRALIYVVYYVYTEANQNITILDIGLQIWIFVLSFAINNKQNVS